VIHILFMGLPLCAFTGDLPHLWPRGQKYIHYDHPMVSNANCADCQRERRFIEDGLKAKGKRA